METLREFRRQRGWSQKDLADRSGVGQDTISGIERGHHEPRPSTLRKLAESLGVEVADFFREPAVPLDEAPEAGQPDRGEASMFEVVHAAARRQARQDWQAYNRLAESGQDQSYFVRHLSEVRWLLRDRYSHDEASEFGVDLMSRFVDQEHEIARLKEEITRLRQELENTRQEAAMQRAEASPGGAANS